MMNVRNNRKWEMAIFWTMLLLLFMGSAGIHLAKGIGPTGKPAATSAPAPPPVQQQEEVYHYNPEGRIDPFKPFVDLEAAAKKKSEKTKALPLNPLQRLGIEQFKLVGVIEDSRGRRAMVQDATGKFYSLVQGTHIGLNKGRVTKILKNSVIVNEKVMTDEGKIQSRNQIMKLRQDEVKP
jgi:type IV pilus assembly protein PilP